MRPKPDFSKIIPHFKLSGEFLRADPYGFGHINDTYAAYFRQLDGTICRFLMQRINHFVFKNPVELMSNISAVTAHLRAKIDATGGNSERETLTLVPTKNDELFHLSEGGYYWRTYIFIEHARTYQIPKSPQHVYNAAWAYGNFQQLLNDFSVDQLYETIPDFHNTTKRYHSFLIAVEEDSKNRARGVKNEIDFVLHRSVKIPALVDLITQGRLPLRVTHNDTKYNNIMIDDETGEGICVIDLDTVMPGSLLYDFGDAIRSITNIAEEDEIDLSRVHFSFEAFKKYTEGYLEATRETITPVELEYLPLSAQLMTLECGIRFLADHLSGDVYFRTNRENQNLDRCRTQFKMVLEMEQKMDQMIKFVSDYSS